MAYSLRNFEIFSVRINKVFLWDENGKKIVSVEASVKMKIKDAEPHTVAESDNENHAFFKAMKKALVLHYPSLSGILLYNEHSIKHIMDVAIELDELISSRI